MIGSQPQLQTVPPRDSDRFVKQPGGEEDGQVGTAVKADLDFAIRYGDVGGNVDQIAKDLAGLRIGIAAHGLGVKGGVKRNHWGGAKGDHFKLVREPGYSRFGAGWSGALRGRRPSV